MKPFFKRFPLFSIRSIPGLLIAMGIGLFPGPISRADEPVIRTIVLENRNEVEIVPKGACRLISSSSKEVLLPAGQEWKILPGAEGGISLSGPGSSEVLFPSPIRIEGVDRKAEVLIRKIPRRTDDPRLGGSDRSYHGTIEIQKAGDNGLRIVSILPLEEYLCGVVPSEIGSTAPMEALKAQAVAARTYALAQLEKSARNGAEFDIYSDISDQVFSGRTHATRQTDQAVSLTRGLALYYRDRLITANYHSNSGGHTEDVNNVWRSGAAIPYLKGQWDYGKAQDYDLSKDDEFRKWVLGKEKTYAHPDQPGIPGWAQKNYRWSRKVTEAELQKRVTRKKNIGTVTQIVLLKRGVSGRVIEMEIQGEKGSLKLLNQMDIRNLFYPALPSSAIVIDIEPGPPKTYLIRGAGSGHGAGMSQVGAMGMAGLGKSFEEILAQYYPGAVLKKAY